MDLVPLVVYSIVFSLAVLLMHWDMMLTDGKSFSKCFREMVDGVLPSLGCANHMLQNITYFSYKGNALSKQLWNVYMKGDTQHTCRHLTFNLSRKVISDIWETLSCPSYQRQELLRKCEEHCNAAHTAGCVLLALELAVTRRPCVQPCSPAWTVLPLLVAARRPCAELMTVLGLVELC